MPQIRCVSCVKSSGLDSAKPSQKRKAPDDVVTRAAKVTKYEKPQKGTKTRRVNDTILSDPPKNSRSSNKQAPTKSKARRRSFISNAAPGRELLVFVCGAGDSGELGLGTKRATEVTIPRLNSNLANVVSVAAGGMHAAALTSDNTVLTWGVNDEKCLGRDTIWDGGLRDIKEDDASESDSDDGDLNPLEATPSPIVTESMPSDTKIVQITAGDSVTFLLDRRGYVYGCGTFRDMNGKFGFSYDTVIGHVLETQPRFTRISGLENITAISAGANYALALDVGGVVFAWGCGEQSQLGRRVVQRRRMQMLVPTRVELPKRCKIRSVHAGIDHAFAVDIQGDTWAWGLNNFAQTGIVEHAGEAEAVVAVPRRVPSLIGKQMKVLHGGRHHSIGITKSGECLVWGRMDGGQIGIEPTNISRHDDSAILLNERGKPAVLLKPTALPINDCIYATAGTDHSIAIAGDGKAWSWGFNVNGQCGQSNKDGDDDDILVARPIERKSLKDVRFCWAGAGGQYSIFAAYADENKHSQQAK